MDTTFRNHLYQISIIFLQFINSVSTPPDRRHMSFKLFFIKFTVCYNILCGIYRHLIDGRRSRPKNIVVGHSKKSVMSCSKGVHGVDILTFEITESKIFIICSEHVEIIQT